MRVIQFKLRAEKPRIPLRFIRATSEPTHPTKPSFGVCCRSLICESRKLSVHLTFVICTNARE